jgi:putative protein-disulfide isomerase
MKFLYFTDPMCSWCYGFGPQFRRLVEAYRGKIGFEVIPGGLRAGETRPLSAERAKFIAHHWDTVNEVTALPFAKRFFLEHPGFVYDTYAPCRAIVAAERCRSGAALPYLETVQKFFYAEGNDPTQPETLTAAAEAIGLSADAFTESYHSQATEAATQVGFARFQEFGGMGFPMVLLQVGEKNRIVTIGYQPVDQLQGVVENILKREAPTASRRLD